MSYTGTLLVQNLSTAEINRAILDLLKKVNDVSGRLETLIAEVEKLQQANLPG